MGNLAFDSSILVELVIFLVSLAFCALTAFLETSVTALRVYKLKELAQTKTKYQNLISLLEKNQTKVLSTILIVKNLTDVTASAFGADLMLKCFFPLPKALAVWVGIIVTTVFILVFGEIIPKIIAKLHANRIFGSTLGLINIIYYLLYPVVQYFMPLVYSVIRKILKTSKLEEEDTVLTSEAEVKFLMEYIQEKKIMDPDKTSMIQSVLELGTKPVKEIMVPSIAITSINLNSTIEEALTIFNKYQFSRLPVYTGASDNVVGMLHFKDIILICSQNQKKSLKELLRPIIFIPENTKINQLLKEFKHQHMHLAMVINEYGSIIGLVSLEDILEEIVGDIRDEYESIPQKIVTLKPNNWLVDTSIELKDLTSFLNISFEKTDSQTLSGFLNEQFQHVPKKGEKIMYRDYHFQIQQASAKRALQILIFKEPPKPQQMSIQDDNAL